MSKRIWTAGIGVLLASCCALSACSGQSTASSAPSSAPSSAASSADSSSGDDNFNPTGWPVVNTPITISAVVRGDSNYTKPYEELELNKQWVEATNVNVDWIQYDNASWNEKINLMLVSGDLPDVVFGPVSDFNELTYAQQGYWQPLQDLIAEYTVNLKKFSEDYPDIYKTYYTPDGNIYSLPRLKGQEDMEYTNRTFINQKWLDTLGLEMPTTVDEFYNVLKAFKEQDPNGNGKADEIPLAFLYNLETTDRKTNPDTRNSIFGLFGMFGRVDFTDHIVIENGQPVFTADKEEYKNAVSFFHKLASEGLLDPEAFTMDVAAYKAKNTTGETVYGVWNGWTVEEATNPPEEGIKEYTMMPPIKDQNGKQSWPHMAYNVAQKGYFFITKNNPYPRETIRWIDYLSDPYVSIQHDWGIEGLGSSIHEDGSWEILGGGLVTTRTAEGMSWLVPTMVPKDVYDKCIYTSPVKAFEAEACKVYSPYGVELFPNAYFTLEESQEMIQLSTDIGGYVGKMTSQWIIDGGIEEQWDEYISTLDKLGLERYVQIYTDTYQRYLEQ